MSDVVLSWLLTYLLHSTLLLGVAWLAWKVLPSEALAIKEALWRTALVGGLLTASLQIGFGVESRLGSWSLGASEVAKVETLASPAREAGAAGARLALPPATDPVATFRATRQESVAATVGETRVAKAPAPDPPAAAKSAAGVDWGRRLLAAWALGAVGLVGWLLISCVALFGRLSDRRPIEGGGLHRLLVRLAAATRMTGVALSASRRIASPLAFGWRRGEICLPDRVASEMDGERQELVLAHELAHLARRDPMWLIVARLIESALFVQPLNRIARRRLQEIAEYRCDDWAVERTGRPITLAKCLADVAEWNLRRGAALPVPTLAVERRRLGRRVARLLDRSYPFPAPARPRWLLAGVAVALVAVVLAAPGVSSGHTPPEAPKAPEAPEAPPEPPAPSAEIAPDPPPPPSVLATPGSRAVPPAPPAPPAPGVASSPALAPVADVSVAAPVLPSAPPLPPAAAVPVAPVLAPPPPVAPAPPAPDPDNGDWVLHDDPWPALAPVPLAEVARVDHLVAVAPDEAYQLAGSLAGLLAAEEWAVIAHEIAAATEMTASPELMAQLVEFSHELEELSESWPQETERLAELAQRLAEVARPDSETLARIERLSAELAGHAELDPEASARIAALSRELAELSMPGAEAMAFYEAYAHQAAAEHEMSEEESAELDRLRTELRRRMTEHETMEREELDRLRAEIRREIGASRPDREEMARLREEIRRELEATRPDREEMARVREELRRELEATRPMREEMRRRSEEHAERLREHGVELREHGRLENERRREVEELRAEVERLREELRREREKDDLP